MVKAGREPDTVVVVCPNCSTRRVVWRTGGHCLGCGHDVTEKEVSSYLLERHEKQMATRKAWQRKRDGINED